MNNIVYIAICHISTFSGTDTKVDIFDSLPRAQAYVARQKNQHGVVRCEIFKSYKVEEV